MREKHNAQHKVVDISTDLKLREWEEMEIPTVQKALYI